MKKKITTLLLMFAILTQFAIACIADSDISVILDGKLLSFDVPPTIIDDRTMVPMRVIFEELGYTIKWNEVAQSVEARSNDNLIAIFIGEHTVLKWGEKYETDVAPCIIDGRTFVPVRIVSELSGCDVDYDAENKAVVITKKGTNATFASMFSNIPKATPAPIVIPTPSPVETITQTVPITSGSESSGIVWVGDTGDKYHRESCSTLSGNKYKMTLQEAKAEGRAPCKRCKP